MSNLSELVESATKEDTDATEKLGAAIGTIADIAGFMGGMSMGIGIIAAIGQIAGLFGTGKSELQKVLEAIQSMFDHVNDHIKAGDALARLRQLDDAQATAQSVWDTLKATIAAKGSGESLDLIEQIRTCREAVDKLSTKSAWLTVFMDEIYYDDTKELVYPLENGWEMQYVGYGAIRPTPDANGDVFTYLYVLPAWMYAEGVFLTVAAALDPQYKSNYDDAIARDADFLQGIHDAIVDGIRTLSPPAWDVPDLAAPPSGRGMSLLLDDQFGIIGRRIDYGAVEAYSGVSRRGQYKILFQDVTQPNMGPLGEEGWSYPSNPAVYQKYQIRLMKQAKALYAAVGLRAVWQLMHRLRGVADPAASAPSYGDWSFKELCGLAGTKSLKDLKKLILTTPPFDTPKTAQGFRELLV